MNTEERGKLEHKDQKKELLSGPRIFINIENTHREGIKQGHNDYHFC